jgi:hypothetical protein
MDSLFQVADKNDIYVSLPARSGIAPSKINTFLKREKTPKCTVWQVLWSEEQPEADISSQTKKTIAHVV